MPALHFLPTAASSRVLCAHHLLTHGTRRRFGTLDCWAGRRLDIIGLRLWQRTGWPNSHSHFPSFTPMDSRMRAILARLPGRQYQRDASKHRCSCPPISIPFHEQQEETSSPWPCQCVYWNLFFYYYNYYCSIRSFLRAACNATPDWRRAAPTKSRHPGPHSHLSKSAK